MKETLKKRVEEKFGIEEVRLVTVRKNNNVFLNGFNIPCRDNNKFSVVVYIDEYIRQIETGELTVEEFLDIVSQCLEQKAPDFNVKDLTQKDYILNNVIRCLINLEKNKVLLETTPHIAWNDLAIVYKIIINVSPGVGAILVNNDIMEMAGLTLEEIDEAADKNTKGDGFKLSSMEEVLGDLFSSSLYVGTNDRTVDGASILLYPELFESLSEELKCDIFIAPSSIHEIIVVPEKDISEAELREIVCQVNVTQVEEGEFLSNSVYKYLRDSKKIIML